MRTRAVLTTFLTISVAAALPAASPAATVSAPVPLAACPTDLAVDATGGVQLLTRTQARGRWTAAVTTVEPAGAIAPGTSVSRPWARPNAVRSVFTGDGFAVAFESGKPKPHRYTGELATRAAAKAPETVSVTMVGPGGASKPQVVSDPSRSADLYRITSRGGTTVVHFRQSVKGAGWLQSWIAVRPAGAARFRKAVSLQSPIRTRFSDDTVALGPDGSGVVVSYGSMTKLPVSARRMSAAGKVGPPIRFADRRADIPKAAAAVGPRGEIVVAVVDTAKPKKFGRAGLFVAELAPGAKRFSKPKLVATTRSGQASDALALAIDATGRVTATMGRQYAPGGGEVYDPGFHTFSGMGTDLAQGPDIDGYLSVGDIPVLTPTADGSVALTWEGDEPLVGGPMTDPPGEPQQLRAQYVSFRAPDGTWSTPATISPPFLWTSGSYAYNRGSAPLPGGGLAMAYSIERSGQKIACSVVRVTP